MAAPIPHEVMAWVHPQTKAARRATGTRAVSTAGKSAAQIAAEFYAEYPWLVRWSAEILTDAQLEAKKIGQLAYGEDSHCRRFSLYLVGVNNPLWNAIQTYFSAQGLTWATRAEMEAVLLAIKADCDALHQHVTNEMIGAGTMELSVRKRLADGGDFEEPIFVERTPQVISLVQALRDNFEA